MKCLTGFAVALMLGTGFQANAQDQREDKPRVSQQEEKGDGPGRRGPGRGGPDVGGPNGGGPGQAGRRPGGPDQRGPGQGGPGFGRGQGGPGQGGPGFGGRGQGGPGQGGPGFGGRGQGGPGQGGPGFGGRGQGGRGQENRGGRGGMMSFLPVLIALDANKDGEISASEINNAAAALKTLDKNGDGKLTADEIQPQFGGRGGSSRERGPGGDSASGGPQRGFPQGGPDGGGAMNPATRLMGMDKNKDGKISKDELPERMQPIMSRLDRDEDGFLTKEELQSLGNSGRRGAGGRARGASAAQVMLAGGDAGPAAAKQHLRVSVRDGRPLSTAIR